MLLHPRVCPRTLHGKAWALETHLACVDYTADIVGCNAQPLDQWFLTWVRSNPRGSVSQFQGFGGLVHPTRMIRDVTLCLAIIGCS